MTELAAYPKYKPSGVEWLGDVPEHWEVRQLGRIGRFSKGSGGSKEDEVSDGIPCVRYGDLYTKHDSFIQESKAYVTYERSLFYTPMQYGDVLFAGSGETIGEIGKSAVNLISGPACCGGDVILFRPLIDVDPKFSGYATNCPQITYQKSCIGRGVTVMHIYASGLKYVWIALPPLAEQVAIARFLHHKTQCIRRYIDGKQRLIGLLKEQKQATIHHAVTHGLDPDVRRKPSGVEWLGEVPEHWEVTRLKAHLIRNESGVWGDNFSDEGTVVLRSTEQTVTGGWKIISPARIKLSASEVTSALLKNGDLVVTKSSGSPNHIGKTTLVDDEVEQMHCCFSNFMQRLRLDKVTASAFVWRNLNSPIGREQLFFQSTTTTGLGNLNGTILGNCRLAFPPLAEQTAIVEYLDRKTAAIDDAIRHTERQIELVEEYRTRLIADVVTGTIDVRAVAVPDLPGLPASEPD